MISHTLGELRLLASFPRSSPNTSPPNFSGADTLTGQSRDTERAFTGAPIYSGWKPPGRKEGSPSQSRTRTPPRCFQRRKDKLRGAAWLEQVWSRLDLPGVKKSHLPGSLGLLATSPPREKRALPGSRGERTLPPPPPRASMPLLVSPPQTLE